MIYNPTLTIMEWIEIGICWMQNIECSECLLTTNVACPLDHVRIIEKLV